MTTVKEIFEYLNELAPVESSMDFDNCGLLVGDNQAKVSCALLTLDITAEAVNAAKDKGAQLIVSHHPVIFNPIKSLSSDSAVYMLAKANIAAVCMHTNLDKAEKIGVNICLAKACGLKDITLDTQNCIAYGEVEPQTTRSLAKNVIAALGCEGVRLTLPNKPIKRVAVSSGAGGGGIFTAADKADAFITGEIKHHELLFAAERGVAVIDAGHRKTEEIVLPTLKQALEERFANTEFEIFGGVNDGVYYMV